MVITTVKVVFGTRHGSARSVHIYRDILFELLIELFSVAARVAVGYHPGDFVRFSLYFFYGWHFIISGFVYIISVVMHNVRVQPARENIHCVDNKLS